MGSKETIVENRGRELPWLVVQSDRAGLWVIAAFAHDFDAQVYVQRLREARDSDPDLVHVGLFMCRQPVVVPTLNVGIETLAEQP